MLGILHLNQLGITKARLRAAEVLYWPGINRDIENMVLACHTCWTFSKDNPKIPLNSQTIPNYPWQKIGVDIFELDRNYYIILIF